jgi:hypothetical protein
MSISGQCDASIMKNVVNDTIRYVGTTYYETNTVAHIKLVQISCSVASFCIKHEGKSLI